MKRQAPTCTWIKPTTGPRDCRLPRGNRVQQGGGRHHGRKLCRRHHGRAEGQDQPRHKVILDPFKIIFRPFKIILDISKTVFDLFYGHFRPF